MMLLNLEKTKILNLCDQVCLFSLFGIAFFLPISKAIIEIFIYLAIFSFLVKLLISKKALPKTPINIAVFIYVLICFLSIFVSSRYQVSIRTFLGKVLTNATLLFIVVDTLNTVRRKKIFIYILLGSSLLLGIDGIYQYFTHKDFIRQRPYIDIPRIYATFPTPNDFGCYLITIMPFVLMNLFRKFKYKRWNILNTGLFLLLFSCLILTVSRGAWFAFIGTILFMSMWIHSLGIVFLIVGIFILATQQFYFPVLKNRISSFFVFQDSSSQDRMIMWTTAWNMFLAKPLVGLGLGTFMFNFPKYLNEVYIHGTPYAHNCYLQMASEIGSLGLVSFLAILAILFMRGVIILNKWEKSFNWYVLLASLAAVLGFCVQMTVDTNFYNLDLGVLLWLMIGVAASSIISLDPRLK